MTTTNANFTRNDLVKVALSHGQPGTIIHTEREMALFRKYLPKGYEDGKPSYYERQMLKAASESIRAPSNPGVPLPIILPGHFLHYAMPDGDSKFLLPGIAYHGQSATVPRCETTWRKGMVRVAVLQANFRLRGALAHWVDVSKDPNILAARLNEPLKASLLLESAFGEPQAKIKVNEFSPETVSTCNTLEPLIVANLAMQELLLVYADRMEKA
jgi:hypothetical protein